MILQNIGSAQHSKMLHDYGFPFIVCELFEKICICYYCEVIPCIPVVVAFQEQILQDQMALGAEMDEVWHEMIPDPWIQIPLLMPLKHFFHERFHGDHCSFIPFFQNLQNILVILLTCNKIKNNV